jgi:outer membrane protein insertion porin family
MNRADAGRLGPCLPLLPFTLPARRLLLRLTLFVLGLICFAGPPEARAQFTITKIVVTNIGPQDISESLVRANIRTKEGEPYNRASVDDDVRNLYATGHFFEVRVAEERTEQGLTLIYVLKGRPTLTDILFEGNKKFTRQQLFKKVTATDFSAAPVPQVQRQTVKPPKTRMQAMIGQPLDERKIFFYSQEIKKLYQKSGYPKTEVKYRVNLGEDRSGRATVTYEILEAKKVKIDDVFFEGARAFSQRKLRKTIKTRRLWMCSWITGSGVLKDEQFEDDQDALAEFYRSKGYIDFELKEVTFLPVSENRLAVVLAISEGKQYKVGAISFKGVTLFPTNDLLRKLKMGVGQTFTPKGLDTDLEAIRDFYGDKGYIGSATARSIPVFARKHANVETGTMDLVYELEEGEKSYIEKIEIKGNTRTRDRVIRRELAVSPGETFDMVKVKLSKQRLEGMRLFEKVETQPEPTDIVNRRNLVVSVEERTTGRLGFGAGFNSVDSLLGFIEVAEENFDLFHPPYFRGGGQKLKLRAQYGNVRQDYLLTFIEPWFLGKKLQFSTDLYHRDLGNQSLNDLYEERRTGLRLGLTRALGSDYLRGSVSYTIESIGIVNVAPNASPLLLAEQGTRLVSKAGFGLAYDTRRSSFNVFLPDGGQRSEFFSELAGGPFGGETDFYRLEARTAWYFKGLFEKHILELGARVGVVDNYGNSTNVHLVDRYFLGGIDTLRGYRYRHVGPREPLFGEPLGGNTYWFASAEYSVPIIELLRFAVFYDIGMVYEDAYSFSTKNYGTGAYNDNWGVGLRINIPQLGPLRLDYGVPITSAPFNGGGGRFQFSVGWTREY